MADAGRAMMLYRGLYESTRTYEKLDVVNFNGSLYISTTDGNLGTEPTDVTKWKLFLQGGVSDNIQATDTYGLVGTKGDSSFVQLLLDSLASRVQGVALNRQTLGYTKKNLLKNTASTITKNGVTFTVNEDKSITVNGIATAGSYLHITDNFEISESGKYILNGTPSDGSISTYYLTLSKYVDDVLTILYREVGKGIEVDLEVGTKYVLLLTVVSNATVSNKTFYPMIRSADITDGTYEPYVDDVDTRLDNINNSTLDTLEEISANTNSNMIAGALALKEINGNINRDFYGTNGYSQAFDLIPNNDVTAPLSRLGSCYISNEEEVTTYHAPETGYAFAFGKNVTRYAIIFIGASKVWYRRYPIGWKEL